MIGEAIDDLSNAEGLCEGTPVRKSVGTPIFLLS